MFSQINLFKCTSKGQIGSGVGNHTNDEYMKAKIKY